MKHFFVFLLCMATWTLLSGMLDPFHLSLGVVCALFVTIYCSKMLFSSDYKTSSDRLRELSHLPAYAIWLLYEVVLANLHLLRIAYSPKLKDKINPRVFSFRATKLNNEFARYVMGISITLVPGTVTISIDDDEFLVHAITDAAASGLPDPMESKVAKIFSTKETS